MMFCTISKDSGELLLIAIHLKMLFNISNKTEGYRFFFGCCLNLSLFGNCPKYAGRLGTKSKRIVLNTYFQCVS